MKKDKQHSPVKAARKTIQERLIKELATIAGQLQKQGINIIIDIEKESKKIAKKITKGAKVDHPAATEATKENSSAAGVKAPVKEAAPAKKKPGVKGPAKENAPAKEKPAAKTPEPKVAKVVVPVATPEPPAAKPATVKAAPQKKAEKK